jgi:uncharacterized protein
MSQTVLTGQRVLPKRAQDTGYAFRFPGLDEALRDLLGSRPSARTSRMLRNVK